ncbi:MAG: CPBP family intramembrane metalloprotease [bacterium]
MFLSRGVTSERNRPRWVGRWVHLAAAVLGVLPIYASVMVLQIRDGRALTLEGFIIYLVVISPLTIVTTLLLLRLLCGESVRDLNLKAGKVSRDLVSGLALSMVILVANVISMQLLSRLMPGSASNASVGSLFVDLAADPMLLGLFLGLLLFLGAASEELVRAFLLSRLWKVWPSIVDRSAAVLASAGLFGLIHLYQGPVHAVWAGILGLIMALYYARFGRIIPLVFGHYVTNALQVVVFAVNAD